MPRSHFPSALGASVLENHHPNLLNGSPEELFSELRRRDLSLEELGTLYSMSFSELIGLARAVQAKCPAPVTEAARDPFTFVANMNLSGLRGPPTFRRQCLDSIGRFTALYANRVFLREPFPEDWFREQEDPTAFMSDGRASPPSHEHSPESTKLLADEIVLRIAVLFRLEPLFRRGLVSFLYNMFPDPDGRVQRAAPLMIEFSDKAASAIYDSLSGVLAFKVSHIPRNGWTMVLVSNARAVVGFQDAYATFMRLKLPISKNLPKAARSMIQQEVRRGHPWFDAIFSATTSQLVVGLVYGAMGNLAYGGSYLTDLPAEVTGLKASNSPGDSATNRVLFEQLGHELPFISGVSVGKLLELRDSEQESFAVYRDSIRKAAREKVVSAAQGQEVFQDIIKPEINRLELLVKRSREKLLGNVLSDAIFGVGAIAFGLYSGVVSPGVGAAIASVGGAKYAVDLLRTASSALQEPPAVRESPFYFMWKAGQAAKK